MGDGSPLVPGDPAWRRTWRMAEQAAGVKGNAQEELSWIQVLLPDRLGGCFHACVLADASSALE